MKLIPVFLLLLVAGIADGQGFFFNPAFNRTTPIKEVTIIKPPYKSYNGSFTVTPAYNDIFNAPEGVDNFEIPAMDYYKEKRVAQVKICDYRGEPKFILDMGPAGLPVKTTTYSNLLLEEQFFYDETGFRNIAVKSYSTEGHVIRVDTIRYSRQQKIINDTAYAYKVIRTSVYKTGRFLNEQNAYYNQKQYNPDMEGPAYSLTVHTASPRNSRKKKIPRPQKFPVNYVADQLYFSRSHVNVEDYTFTFKGNPVNPGEKGLEMYVPELYLRSVIQYSDLLCERFQEPRFMRQNYTCGYGMQRMQEYSQFQQSIYYTYSQNDRGLQDTCYSNAGSEKGPIYHFTYSFYE